MKKITLLCTVVCTLLSIIQTFAGKRQEFSIKGKFKELKSGDKIIFQRFVFPGFNLQKGFEVTVSQNGKFRHKDTVSHEWLYLMSIVPANGELPKATRNGRQILIRPGDNIVLTAEHDRVYFPDITGGIYSNPKLREAMSIEDSLELERTLLMRTIDTKRDSKEAEEAAKAFNSFHAANAKHMENARNLMRSYYESPDGEELALINILQRVNSSPYEKNKAAFDKLSESSKQSRHGRIAARELEKIDRLAIGKQAPSFILTRSDSTKISSGDYHGKYLLIYHWGMCPGSMQADPSVTALFNRTDRSGVMILGVTSGRKAVEELYKNISSDAIIYEMNAKERLHSMLNHPYEDFDLNIPGNDLYKLFAMGGLPYFVLISPDGKIIARGYHEALAEAEKELLPITE